MSQVTVEQNLRPALQGSSLLSGIEQAYGSNTANTYTNNNLLDGCHLHDDDIGQMYVPEVNPSQMAAAQQQEDLFDDIVANTNPDLIASVPSANQVAMASLYTRHNDAFFSVKRHLMEVQRASTHNRSNSSDRPRIFRRLQETTSEFELEDKDDVGIWSDIQDEDCQDASLLLSLMSPEHRLACRDSADLRRKPCGANLFSGANSDFDPFESQQLPGVEYENCHEARSCCGSEDSDNALNSTLTFSVQDGELVSTRSVLPNLRNLVPNQESLRYDSKPRRFQRAVSHANHEELESDFEMPDINDKFEYPFMQRHVSQVHAHDNTMDLRKPIPNSNGLQSPPSVDKKEQQPVLEVDEDQIWTGSKSPQIEPTMQSLFSCLQQNGDCGMECCQNMQPQPVFNLEPQPVEVDPNQLEQLASQMDNIKLDTSDDPIMESSNESALKVQSKSKAIKKVRIRKEKQVPKNKSQLNNRMMAKLEHNREVIEFRKDSIGKSIKLNYCPLEACQDEVVRFSNKTEKDMYYKNFDFFFNRTCFRIMTEFYKDLFLTFTTARISQLKRDDFAKWQLLTKSGGIVSLSADEMSAIVNDFLVFTFGEDMKRIQWPEELNRHAMMILFSHRYTKQDRFIVEAQLEFDIVRDVMYKYSKKAQDKFLAEPVQAFMFAAFALSDEGQSFLKSKPDIREDKKKLAKMLKDMVDLKDLAVAALNSMAIEDGSLGNAAQLKSEKKKSQLSGELMAKLVTMTKGQL